MTGTYGLAILKAGAPSHPLIKRTVGMMDLNHLVRLVDDLLDVSRITHGRVELHTRPIYLRDVLSRAIEAAQSLIDAQSHRFRIENRASEVVVEGDPDRLQQVFSNLIINAAKYTSPGGRIIVSIVREGGDAVVSVADNGIGIAHEALEHVFEVFAKGPKQRPGEGLGIGLTLVRLLVGLHGGRVVAASLGAGQGSTFTVHLPVSEATPRMPRGKLSDTARESALRAGRRVLVVDDNGDAAASLALLLELKGYRVATAADGERAIERAREFRPDLIFMDLGLPGIDGVEAAKRIHAECELNSIPIVALTGWGKNEDRKRTATGGMVAHLVKPVAPEQLEEILRSLEADDSQGDRLHVH